MHPMRRGAFVRYLATFALIASFARVGVGAESQPKPEPKSPSKESQSPQPGSAKAAPEGQAASSGGPSSTMPSGRPARIPFAELVRDAKPIEGLIKLYRKDDRLFAELGPTLLDRDLIVVISIARGIGEGQLLGGMSWGFGDDWIWQFRQVDDRIQVVRRNVRFTAAQGTPESLAVKLAYTDSILFSLPVLSTAPSGAAVVDLGTVFMSDLPRISGVLPGFVFARDRSSWASVKGFRDNVEIEVAATYTSPGTAQFETVPDSRGVTVNVHYSVSLLPQTGYRPRLADDRVGYFVTAVKDFSRKYESDRFVRYINRWNLVKADPSLEVSPPQKTHHLLAGKDHPLGIPQTDSRGYPGMEQGVRESGLCQRDRGAGSATGRYLGSGGHQLQHVSLDNGGSGFRHGAVAGQPADGRNPRRGRDF